MAFKFIDLDNLQTFLEQLRLIFAPRERRSDGSGWKVLSDNNLTDDLLDKINNADGATGDYAQLSNKPSINGHELTGGDNTADSLGLALKTDVTAVYRIKGSSTFAQLPGLNDAQVGDTWNVSDGFTTTADFMEGAGVTYSAGTNIVCVDDNGARKWDAMAGMLQLSYATDADIDAMFA